MLRLSRMSFQEFVNFNDSPEVSFPRVAAARGIPDQPRPGAGIVESVSPYVIPTGVFFSEKLGFHATAIRMSEPEILSATIRNEPLLGCGRKRSLRLKPPYAASATFHLKPS